MNLLQTSYRHSIIVCLVIPMVALFWGFSCSEDNAIKNILGDSEPPGVKKALYVSPTGNGAGNEQNPFSTIQQALDSVVADSTITHILIATGEYDESLRIRTPIVIVGSLDPSNKWSRSSSERTKINGQQIDGHSIAICIRDIIGTVVLERLYITGSDAVDSGATSFGIYSSNVSSVQLVDCQVTSGLGMAGRSGTPGQAGDKGDSAYDRLAGQAPVAGGNGGYGQDSFDGSAEPGEQGFCSDGTQTGGVPGVDGKVGNIGIKGDGGISDLVIVADTLFLLPLTESGSSGQIGQPGCGGGGGAGVGGTFGHTGFEPGGIGGGGGAGGFGGEGGSGGKGGGSTIGIFIKGGSLIAKDSPIFTSGGGIGGNGGIGGIGGSAGKGSPGILLASTIGDAGGDGGSGGRGGHGGGGSGGWSIGVLSYQSQVDVDSAIWVHPGFAGGGGSSGNFPAPRGQNGQRVKVWTIE